MNIKIVLLSFFTAIATTLLLSQVYQPVGLADQVVVASQAKQPGVFDRVVRNGEIRCAYIYYPPYFYTNESTGEFAGVNVDLMESIARRMDVRLAWTEEVGWANLTEGLKTGRYDAVCSAVWKTTKRAKEALFSEPYGYSPVYAWAQANDMRFDGNLMKFNHSDVRVSTIDGNATDSILDAFFPEAQKVSMPQIAPISDILLNVATGKADITLIEPKVARAFMSKNPGTLRKVELDAPVASYPFALVFPKEAIQLKEVVDAAIEEIAMTPELANILAKYNITREEFLFPVFMQ